MGAVENFYPPHTSGARTTACTGVPTGERKRKKEKKTREGIEKFKEEEDYGMTWNVRQRCSMGCRGAVSHNVGATPTPLELYVLYVNLWIHIYYSVTY